MDVLAALDALSALSSETRLWVFRLLVQAGTTGLSAGDIAEHLDARQNTMSSHLKILSGAGLINSERQGRSIIYRANYATVRELIEFLMQDCCAGHEQVCRPLTGSLAPAAQHVDNR